MNYQINRTAHAHLPTAYGQFSISVFKEKDGKEHVALTRGDMKADNVITRIHSKCLTGDTFMSLRCDCHAQLHKSFEIICEKDKGVIIYLNQEGRGIGLTQKIKAYALQEAGLDTFDANIAQELPADGRDYRIAADILNLLGVASIKLLTNNPEKISDLKKHGIKINKHIPLEISANEYNRKYLETKKNKFGHLLKKI